MAMLETAAPAAKPSSRVKASAPDSRTHYRKFELGQFSFERDEYFVTIGWSAKGARQQHRMSADAFLRQDDPFALILWPKLGVERFHHLLKRAVDHRRIVRHARHDPRRTAGREARQSQRRFAPKCRRQVLDEAGAELLIQGGEAAFGAGLQLGDLRGELFEQL